MIKFKYHLVLSFFVFLLVTGEYKIQAQSNVQFTFGGGGDDFGMSIVQTDDKGYIIQSRTTSYGVGDMDVMYTRTDSTGKILWSKTYGTQAREYAKQIRKDHGNGYITSNWATPGFRPDDDWHMMRIDEDGNLLDQQFFGGGQDDELHCFNLTSDGGYIIAGNTESFASSPKDIWVIKTDFNFTPQWNTIVHFNANEHPRAILEAQNLNYFVLGNKTLSGLATRNILLSYFDNNGYLSWSKEITASDFDDGRDAVFDGQDIICVGFSQSYGVGGNDVLVFKVSTTGNLIWSKTYGGSGDDEAYTIVRGGDGNYLVGGSTTSWGNGGKDIFLMNINGEGDLIAVHSSGGNQDDGTFIFHANTAGQSGYIIGCSTNSYGYGGSDVLVVKTDLNGVSCCTDTISDVNVTDVNLTLLDLNPSTGSSMNNPAHNWGSRSENVESEVICIEGLRIEGEDTVCYSGNDFKYSIQPPLDLNFQWSVPPGAIITGSSGDTVIFVQFADISGYITAVLEDACDAGPFDSIYVHVGTGASADAGEDAQFCQGEYYDFNLASTPPFASDYDSLYWLGGNGYFSDPTILAPIYYPEVDELGEVFLDLIAFGTGGCGNDTSSMMLTIFQSADVALGNDTAICGNINITLDAGAGFDEYYWQDGSRSQIYTADYPGTYWVRVANGICEAADTIQIIQDCPSTIWFPNCFTPNDDGFNDVFGPVYSYIDYYKLYIFNRWGQLLFESNDVEHTWDGTYKGRECPNGVYVFLAEYEDNISGKNETITGSVTILK